MKHKHPTIIRIKNRLYSADEQGNPIRNTERKFASIGLAKKESRALQQANGGCGMGYVRKGRE